MNMVVTRKRRTAGTSPETDASLRKFMPLKRRYFTPDEAGEQIGADVETIRQWVLWFDAEPNRIPLYHQLTGDIRVTWRHPIDLDDGRVYPRRTILRNREQVGKAYLVDVTDFEVSVGAAPEYRDLHGDGPIVGGEASLGPGLWVEIDPYDAHRIASMPEETFPIDWLRGPEEELGPMPARALIGTRELESAERQPQAKFSECWIAAEDVERIQSARTESTASAGRVSNRERAARLRLIAAMLSMLRDKDFGCLPSDAKVIDLLVARYGEWEGISARTLQSVFAQARRQAALPSNE